MKILNTSTSKLKSPFSLFQKSARPTQRKNDLDKGNLRGAVRALRATTYKAVVSSEGIEKGKKIVPEGCYYESILTKYHKNGYLRRTVLYEKGNSMMEWFTYSYKNKVLLTKEGQYDEDYKLIGSNVNSYNGEGELIETLSRDDNGNPIGKDCYAYNEQGELIEKSQYNYKGALLKRYCYSYDNNGRLTEMNLLSKEGELRQRDSYEYDNSGELSLMSRTDGDGREVSRSSYSYTLDSAGNWIEQIKFNELNAHTPEYITERVIQYYKSSPTK